jgi:hypothetical protein
MTENETEKQATSLHPEDFLGVVLEVVSARDAPNKFDSTKPQVRMVAKGQKLPLFVSWTSGIAKGMKSGKLKPSAATPLRVTGTTGYGTKGPYSTWTLAPKA